VLHAPVEAFSVTRDHATAGDLLDLIRQPPSMGDALCKEYTTLSWIPERGEPVDEQLKVCRRCKVRLECLQAAVAGSEVGIWGGTSGVMRRRLRVPLREAVVAIAELVDQPSPPRPDRWADARGRALELKANDPSLTHRAIGAVVGVSGPAVTRWLRKRGDTAA